MPSYGLGLALLSAAGLLLAACGPAPRAVAPSAATHFLKAYVNPTGAVVRRDQGGDVVSEGQAYGMLIAELAGDPSEVRLIWEWSKAHLLQSDGLLAYHAEPDGRIISAQAATDADTLAAYALLRYRGPESGTLHRAGRRLAAAVLRNEAITGPGGTPLLTAGPWAKAPPPTLNPSYWMPGVYQALARYTGNPEWSAAATEAVSLVRQLTSDGKLLPPDWAQLDGQSVRPIPNPGGGEPIQYGLDAARVPVFFAASCVAGARSLSAGWWENYFSRSGRARSSIALTMQGAVVSSESNPLTLVAAAASASAAGDARASARLISQARALGRRYPTYYGDAWLALGPALIQGKLAHC